MPEAPPNASFLAALSLLQHVYFSPVLNTLVRGNVPDYLEKGPLDASELAGLSGLNALALTRVLRALAGFGAFREDSPGVFANNPVSDHFRKGGGLHNCALFYGSDHLLKSATALGHSVATGESATTHVFGESVWEHMRKHPEDGVTFGRALAELRGNEHQQIADAYDWTAINTVVDVGGGVGTLLAAILGNQPAMRGTLVEQPFVLADADRVLTERGVRARCELVGASFFNPIPAVAEVWTMCQVLHDWADADACTILTQCRHVMRPTDRLLVAEMLTVPCQPNVQIGLVDMAMLMYFGEARQRTVDEYTQLFDATGFALTRVLPTAGAFSIVEAKPI